MKAIAKSALLSVLVLICLARLPFAQEVKPASKRELNGYFLGQHISVLDSLKISYKTIKQPPFTWRLYELDKKRHSFIGFGFHEQRKDYIHGIQLTGSWVDMTYRFYGVRMGDQADEAIKKLGKPSKIESKEFEAKHFDYENHNYSFMATKDSRVYSIQIIGYDGFAEDPKFETKALEQLKKGVLNHNIEALLKALTPDVEVYGKKEIIFVKEPLRTELSLLSSPLRKVLLDDVSGVKAFFKKEDHKPDVQMRLYPDTMKMGWVAKYPKSKILEELVFAINAGQYRIWEIKLREKPGKSRKKQLKAAIRQ